MDAETITRELQFKAVRSSGPGGQHVNKTASKVEMNFNILSSKGLSETEKQRLQNKLNNLMTISGEIILRCSDTRSQHRNKALVIERLLELLKDNLKVSKPRKKTTPSKSAMEKRLRYKREQALKKSNRKPPPID